MNLSFHIARRYLIAKKTHSAINVISMISLVGVSLGTMALVIVLSVYNGFDQLIDSMYSGFNSELKISPVEGRTFQQNDISFEAIAQVPGVEYSSFVLETQALVRYKDKQSPCVLKGVDENFIHVTNIDSTIQRGEWSLQRAHHPGTVMGYLLARTLGAGIKFVEPLNVYVPKREGRISLVDPSKSFVQQYVFPNAFFLIGQPEIDENYMILPLQTVRNLLDYSQEVSAMEIKTKSGFDVQKIKGQIQHLLPPNSFKVQDRREQEASLFRMMKTEKWMTFLILMFILLIAAFNIVGTMSMLMLDKKQDMITLRNMGASNKLIRTTFLFEGWMISLFGALFGLVLGAFFCFLQMHFGLISMGEGFVVDAYPLVMKGLDVVVIFATVCFVGFWVAYLPVRYIRFSA